MSITPKSTACIAVATLAILAVVQAATFRYREREDAIRKQAREQLQKLGLSRDQAKLKYPTPEIALVSSGCLVPGSTGEVAVKGRFAPGTSFVLRSDALEVVKETATPAEYRATVKVAPNVPSHTAPVVAISPVSGISATATPGVAVGARTEWVMEAANGWRVVARSPAVRPCGGTNYQDPYEVEFFRKGDTAPFEKRTATGSYADYNSTESFSISQMEASAVNNQQRIAHLVKKMSDPKLSDAERQKIITELQQAQQAMIAAMPKISSMDDAMKASREAEAKRRAFGCERIEVTLQGANLTGSMRCGETVGRNIAVTGNMRVLGR